MTSLFLLDFRMSWEQTQFVSDPPEPGAPPEVPQLSRCSLHVHPDDMWSYGSFAQVEQKQQNRETNAPHVCGSTWRLTADKERWRHSWSALTCSHIRWEWNKIRAETFSNVSASVPTGSVDSWTRGAVSWAWWRIIRATLLFTEVKFVLMKNSKLKVLIKKSKNTKLKWDIRVWSKFLLHVSNNRHDQ